MMKLPEDTSQFKNNLTKYLVSNGVKPLTFKITSLKTRKLPLYYKIMVGVKLRKNIIFLDLECKDVIFVSQL